MALQNLAVTVNGLKESIHLQATRVSTISNENNQRSSKYHSKFSELLNKYSRFANEYKFELADLHQSLLNDISLQQKQRAEQEREMQESFSSKSSHSNLEIAENVQDTEYHSPVTNMNNMNNNISLNSINSPQIREDSEFEPSQNTVNTVSMDIPTAALPSQPQPIESRKSIPVSQPKKNNNNNYNKQRNNNKTTNNRNNQNQRKTQRQNTKNTNKPAAAAPKVQPAPVKNNKTQKSSKPLIVRTVTAQMDKKEEKKDVDEKYVYNEKNVKFDLPFQVWNEETKKYDKKVYKHTTVIYIGNIPTNIKVAAVQFFVMKKFKVTMRQIEETKLAQGRGFSQSAQVRFRSDVPLDHIVKYMDMLNSENAKIKEDKKAAQDSMHVITKKKDKDGNDDKKKSKKKAVKTSWQTRVFIKFQDPDFHYSYYENEDEMYNDRRARHELFIRNFDVLDAKCHKQLTDILLQFGDLYKDIQIKLDAFGDPYCIVIFKYKNDAVYCCNSDIYFGGRRLEIRYSKRN